jgi:hypothetical protein
MIRDLLSGVPLSLTYKRVAVVESSLKLVRTKVRSIYMDDFPLSLPNASSRVTSHSHLFPV